MPSLLLQQAEGLANFGEILAFICKTLKTRQIFLRCYGNLVSSIFCQGPDSSSHFSAGNLIFARMNLKPAAMKSFGVIGHCVSVSAKSTVFRIR